MGDPNIVPYIVGSVLPYTYSTTNERIFEFGGLALRPSGSDPDPRLTDLVFP